MRSGLQIDMQEHETVQALMQVLGVPNDLPRIILVNGQHVGEGRLLTNGDIVSVFPPLIGGCASRGT
jgi:molybdopterin converting factor small subunit